MGLGTVKSETLRPNSALFVLERANVASSIPESHKNEQIWPKKTLGAFRNSKTARINLEGQIKL